MWKWGLLSVFDDSVKKYGQDVNSDQVHDAEKKLKNFTGVIGDTLREPAFLGKKFKWIIANPPFSIKWDPQIDERFSDAPALAPKSKADYAFILHILYYLQENGTAVVMGFPGILYRGNAEGKIRQWLVEQNYIDKVIAVDGKKFADTNIATCVLVLKKNKQNKDITFIHNDSKRTVGMDEVKKNDWILSVSAYIDETPQKKKLIQSLLKIVPETISRLY